MKLQDWDDQVNREDNTINFDYARIYCTYKQQRCDTRTIALGVSNYLTARANHAVLAEAQEWPQDDTYQLSGNWMKFQSQDHQWFSFAGRLAHYGSYMHNDLWIGLPEYGVLRLLQEEIADDIEIKDAHNGWRGAGEQGFYYDSRFYVAHMIKWFKQDYTQSFPEFLLEIIKT